jgi:hypothetical protein
MENQLFVGIGTFLGQICSHIDLNIDSAGSSVSFFEIRDWDQEFNQKLKVRKQILKK